MKTLLKLDPTSSLRSNAIQLCSVVVLPEGYQASIYTLRHLPTNRCYVGHTTQKPFDRLYGHLKDLVGGTHLSTFMQNVWNKYGNGEFEFELLEFCLIENRLDREQFWIDTLNSVFNIAKVAGSTYGTKRTFEDRQKFSEIQKRAGNVKKYLHTDAARKRHREVVSSIEYREKMSKVMKGRVVTEETRKRMSAARQQLLATGWRLQVSEFSRQQTSKRFKGKKKTPEHQAKINAGLRAAAVRKRSQRVE